MQLVEGYFFEVNCFKLSEASLLVLAESMVNAGRPRGRNTQWCPRLTSLQESEYQRMQKEQLWLNWTNRWTTLILTCLGPLDFFSDDELLLIETDLTEQTETNEETEQTEISQLNDEDIDNFNNENRNKNTKCLRAKVASEQKLDKLLAHFVLNVRKPDTLTCM